MISFPIDSSGTRAMTNEEYNKWIDEGRKRHEEILKRAVEVAAKHLADAIDNDIYEKLKADQ